MPTKPKRFANGQPVLPCQLLPQTSPCFLPMKDDWVWVARANPCACRKPKSGRIGDAARPLWRATRCVRFAEPGERSEDPGPMTDAFSQYCNSEHTLAGSDANAPRPARRCGPRTRDGSFRSTARQTNSATASPLQWVCRGCPWLVIG